MQEREIRALVIEYQNTKDETVFDAIKVQMEPVIKSVCWKCGRKDLFEDLYHEGVVALWYATLKYRPVGECNFGFYVWRCVKNKIRQILELEMSYRKMFVNIDDDFLDEKIEDQAIPYDLTTILGLLTEREKKALSMLKRGLSREEMATELREPVHIVHGIVARIFKKGRKLSGNKAGRIFVGRHGNKKYAAEHAEEIEK